MKIFNIVNKNLRSSINFPYLKRSQDYKNLPIITISREKGAGGIIVAEKVAKKLGKKWDYYHKDIVDKIAEQSHTSSERVKDMEEKQAPYLQDFFEGWFGGNGLDISKYHKILIKVLFDLGSKGNSIIVGRGANFLFPNALKVRIIADQEQRIKWLMQFEKISEKAAKAEAEETDRESNKFISNLYNKDITDPKNYDLVIKTSLQLSVDDAAEVITRVAKKRFKL